MENRWSEEEVRDLSEVGLLVHQSRQKGDSDGHVLRVIVFPDDRVYK